MKVILISIKPRFVVKILKGEKTIEVRKGTALYKATQKLIDEYGFAEFYVYCTKDKKYASLVNRGGFITGMVVFKFRCYEVEEIKFTQTEWRGTKETPALQVLDKSCLSAGEIMTYLKDKNKGKDGIGCAIHISDLEIFDKPKELSEFYKIGYEQSLKDALKEPPYPLSPYSIQKKFALTKAPQRFAYIEVGE